MKALSVTMPSYAGGVSYCDFLKAVNNFRAILQTEYLCDFDVDIYLYKTVLKFAPASEDQKLEAAASFNGQSMFMHFDSVQDMEAGIWDYAKHIIVRFRPSDTDLRDIIAVKGEIECKGQAINTMTYSLSESYEGFEAREERLLSSLKACYGPFAKTSPHKAMHKERIDLHCVSKKPKL